MALKIRKPPSPSDLKNPRAAVYFFQDLYDALRSAGSKVVDVGSIASGDKASFTITVDGAIPDKGQTVELGLPSAINTSLVPWAYVSAINTVTVVLYNPTGGAIDPASGTYAARVIL